MLETFLNQSIATIAEVLVGTLLGGLISLLIARWRERNHLEMKLLQLQEEIAGIRADVKEEISVVKESQSALLRHTIRTSNKKWIGKGWIPLDEKQDIMSCYDSYEKCVLQNGVIDDSMKQMRELPNIEPQKD